MALTLVKEDGSGLVNANSYADKDDGDAYHEARLNATAWTGASDANKEIALCMATSLIDRYFDFGGYKTSESQALQWPRELVPNPDIYEVGIGQYWPSDEVPKPVQDATCELARLLLGSDRTAAPQGEGIKRFKVEGAVEIEFDKFDRADTVPTEVQMLLSKVGGSYKDGFSGSVKLRRS